jgi:large subunit ribosomal protein L29
MKINELRKLSTEELNKNIADAKRELLDLRLKNATGALEKPSKIKELKKDVARMKTIINERKNEEAGGDK